MSEILHATSGDEALGELIELTRQGWPSSRTDVPIGAKPYWNYKHEITSNGMAEKGVQIAKALLMKAKESGQDPYLALLDYRNTPRDNILGSPVQRLFGRRTNTLLPTTEHLLKPKILKPETVHKRLVEKRQTQKTYYDRQTKKLPELQPGDNIRLQTDKGWKPATIVFKAEQPRSYYVETAEGVQYRRNRKHLLKTGETFSYDRHDDNDIVNSDNEQTSSEDQTTNTDFRRSIRAKTKPRWHSDYEM
ncbi:hypothetical protein BSL78_09678 [Apostichopus japonicus]|uniref:Uncharacterized protein n=1 Tax=Stichopus japonicus TaxID=307972 RepID=A0A2G8KZL8_STIJA|nr:hypothetical protein BSL78_09678 [Apostichopus japonicus]